MTDSQLKKGRKTLSKKEKAEEFWRRTSEFISEEMWAEFDRFFDHIDRPAFIELHELYGAETDALLLTVLRASYPENKTRILQSAPELVRYMALFRFHTTDGLLCDVERGVASLDPVAADAYYCLFQMVPQRVQDVLVHEAARNRCT